MLVIGHKAPMEVSAIACRIESFNQPPRAASLKQVSGPQRCRPDAIQACDPLLYLPLTRGHRRRVSVRRPAALFLSATRKLSASPATPNVGSSFFTRPSAD